MRIVNVFLEARVPLGLSSFCHLLYLKVKQETKNKDFVEPAKGNKEFIIMGVNV